MTLRDAQAACIPPDCALDLGSSGAFVSFGSTPDLGLSTFTIETWFQRQGSGVGTSTGSGGVTAIPLVSKGRSEQDGSNRDMNWFLGIRASDGVLVADFEEGAGGVSPGLNHPVVGSTPIASGVWYHASYDGTTWRLYLNGVLDGLLVIDRPVRSGSSAGGMDFIAIGLEYDTSPDPGVLGWANSLLQTHATRRAIVYGHHIVNAGSLGSFGTQGQAIYDALKANANLFLMLSGHVCNGSPPNIQPEGLCQDVFAGRTVYSMLSDYQCDSAGETAGSGS